jgi:uncharacterized DUF497 family protein
MEFEWDDEKERINIEKHGIPFKLVGRIFSDPFRMERLDNDANDEEDRWQTIGTFKDVLFVVYTERGNSTRIISARLATPKERRIYYGNREIHSWRKANS